LAAAGIGEASITSAHTPLAAARAPASSPWAALLQIASTFALVDDDSVGALSMIDLHTATASPTAPGVIGTLDGTVTVVAVVFVVELVVVAVEPLWLLDVELLPPPPQLASTAAPSAAKTSHVDSRLVMCSPDRKEARPRLPCRMASVCARATYMRGRMYPPTGDRRAAAAPSAGQRSASAVAEMEGGAARSLSEKVPRSGATARCSRTESRTDRARIMPSAKGMGVVGYGRETADFERVHRSRGTTPSGARAEQSIDAARTRSGAPNRVAEIVRLQRAVGNRALGDLLRRQPDRVAGPAPTITVQRMRSKISEQEIPDAILIGERHDASEAKDYLLSKLPVWSRLGYNRLGIEKPRDHVIPAESFEKDQEEVVRAGVPLATHPYRGFRSDDVLRAAKSSQQVRGAFARAAELFGELAVVIVRALETGYDVECLDTLSVASVRRADRVQAFDSSAVSMITAGNAGLVALVGASHLAGIGSALASKGWSVTTEDHSSPGSGSK
jgi:hypothetical protein